MIAYLFVNCYLAQLLLLRWYLVLNRTNSAMIPPIPAGRGGALGGGGQFHWSLKSPLAQQWVQVGRAKLFLYKQRERDQLTDD